MNVLVTTGPGYIGSVVVEQLIKNGREVVVYDNLSEGTRRPSRPKPHSSKPIYRIATRSRALDRNRIEAIIHLAASSLVGESVENPHLYFTNNVGAGVSLLDAMLTAR